MNRCSFCEWIPILPWPLWPLAGQFSLGQHVVVGSMTLLLAVRGKHCHEKYVWTPVCFTTAPYHGLVWSYPVYDLMSQVVFCVQPSVRAAYLAHETDVGTSIVSVYNKLNGLETRTSAELVRYSAREFAPLIAQMGGERMPWLD